MAAGDKLKTLLVFGAGASFDSGFDGRYQLPMSRDIFNLQIPSVKEVLHEAEWPVLSARLPELKQKLTDQFEGDLEKFLDDLVASGSDPALQDEIRWYLQSLMLLDPIPGTNGSNHYYRWMDKLRALQRQGVMYISDVINFNYDPMLDEVVRSEFGLSPRPADYIVNSPRYIKPHGSADWILIDNRFDFGRVAGNGHRRLRKMAASRNMRIAGNAMDQVEVVNRNGLVQAMGDNRNTPLPVLVLPVVSKRIAQDLFTELVEAMASAIEDADHIILIGYRGADKDFLSCIQGRTRSGPTAKKLIVSVIGWGGSAREVFDNLVSALPDENLKQGFIFEGGFSGAVSYLEDGTCTVSEDGLLALPIWVEVPKTTA